MLCTDLCTPKPDGTSRDGGGGQKAPVVAKGPLAIDRCWERVSCPTDVMPGRLTKLEWRDPYLRTRGKHRVDSIGF